MPVRIVFFHDEDAFRQPTTAALWAAGYEVVAFGSSLVAWDFIKPDTAFDPDKIASAFLELHDQPKESFAAEVVFDGK